MRLATAAAALAALVLPITAPAQQAAHDMQAVDGFRIDRTEVTIGQFRRFVTATGVTTAAEKAGGGFQFRAGWERMAGWTWQAPFGRPGADDEPAVHVTWHEALAYCRWAGLRLPTDAEWARAAYLETRAEPPAPFQRGRTYAYPTGDSPDGANQLDRPKGALARELGRGAGHVPVRTTQPGVNGLWDMGGNVWEWVDHETAAGKRTRGSSWWYGASQLRADNLAEKPADFPAVYIGLRCAADG
jgi:formylglycine-generating enzyme required for sulfatase activity